VIGKSLSPELIRGLSGGHPRYLRGKLQRVNSQFIQAVTCAEVSKWPVHPSEQPTDANCNDGGRVGLRLDGAT
jgi:hypothetical protein